MLRIERRIGLVTQRLVQAQMAREVQGENNQYDHTYAGGVIAPALTVRPNWKTSYKRDDYHYSENE
jgi:hypothetical protein